MGKQQCQANYTDAGGQVPSLLLCKKNISYYVNMPLYGVLIDSYSFLYFTGDHMLISYLHIARGLLDQI